MYQKIKGIVIKGKNLGNKIGFPTANIVCKKGIIKNGTYKINIIYNNDIYRGAGMFDEKKEIFEAYIFNFNKSIYEEEIQIIIHEKIRDNKKFDSFDELKKQIKEDIIIIKKRQDYVLTFGTFDIIHPGHVFFLNQAKYYGDRLITIVATDKNIKKFKGKNPLYNSEKRLNDVKSLQISDRVFIGESNNPLIWVDLYTPNVICLGYDQVGFSEKLKDYIKEKNLDIEIIRIEPYKENIYKSSLIKKRLK